MKILFVSSGAEICRAVIAKHILQSFDEKLEIFAGGTDPVAEISPEQQHAMSCLGYEMEEGELEVISSFSNITFDFLITVSHGIRDQIKKSPVHYLKKLHMEFSDLCHHVDKGSDINVSYREIRDEMVDELNYFYHHYART